MGLLLFRCAPSLSRKRIEKGGTENNRLSDFGEPVKVYQRSSRKKLRPREAGG